MEKLRIFAASPSDMSAERAKVETVAEMLKPLADYLGIVLEVLDWRVVVPKMGRPEQVILDQLKPTSWDVFIGILWHRFGTPPGGKDPNTQKEYLSGTEEEFRTAYRLWEKCKRPRIMIYRCIRDIPPDMLDPDQFKCVKEFFSQFEAVKGEHPGLYQSFDTTDNFVKMLLHNLQRLLLDYDEHLKGRPISPEVIQFYAPKIPNNLPRRAAFFGRDKDMEKVMAALSPIERGWGVVIDGIGGIGKTALALEAAHRAQEQQIFDAFVFVSAKEKYLAPEGIRDQSPAARTLDDFINQTARVLGEPAIAQLTDQGKRDALLDVLIGKRTLLIYDNLEILTKEEQEALSDFLRFLPQNSKAILTSRRRGGEGALWLRLEKLEWEAGCQIIADQATRNALLRYKLMCAGEVRWQELYDETKGSPLALMHVLGLMRTRTTLTFDGALELLRGNRDADLQEFVFREARKELGASEIAALRALSFFVPSAPFDSLMEVANLSRNVMEMAIDRLDALSLLDKLEGEERYGLHPLTRNFVRGELLADSQIAGETGRRFAKYWVDYGWRYGWDKYKTYDRLEAEWSNLDAAAEWLWQKATVRVDSIDDKDAAKMLNDLRSALSTFLSFGGRWDERIGLSERAYEAMCALKDWSEAGWCAFRVAITHFNRGNTDETVRWTDRCAEAWKRGGSKSDQASGTRIRGLVARQRKDYNTANQLFQDALAIFRDLNNDEWVATVLNDLGNIECDRENWDSAERYYREALSLSEKIDYKEGQSIYMTNLGEIALNRERWVEARDWYQKGLSLAQGVGRQDSIASAKKGLAHVHEEEGRPDLALPLAQEALAINERLRDRHLAKTRELVERLKSKVRRT